MIPRCEQSFGTPQAAARPHHPLRRVSAQIHQLRGSVRGEVDPAQHAVAMVDDPCSSAREGHGRWAVADGYPATTLFVRGDRRTTCAPWSSATHTEPPPIQVL
jgi:hypothetical protein